MLKKDPWQGYIKPSKMVGNLYFVGTKPASTHIIDTGEGLIMIDPGHQESLYLVLHNMWELGLKPGNIRYILLTHCHYDHTDATQALVELTGATVCFPKADLPLLNGEIYHYGFRPFKPDILLEDGDTVTLGNTVVRCVATPGHTDGTMSYFFPVTDGEHTYRAAMHGGVGVNSMKADFLKERDLSTDCRRKFAEGLDKVENEQVDITVGNHVGQNDTVGKLSRLGTEEGNPFIDPTEWKRFIEKCRNSLDKLNREDPC